MSKNPNKLVEEILGNLIEEVNIQPTIHNLFQTMQPEEISLLIEKLKHRLAQKNDNLRKLLSNNHQHLFACTDLVDQLKEFSKSAHKNHEKLAFLKKIIEKNDNLENVEKNDNCEKNSPSVEKDGHFNQFAVSLDIEEDIVSQYFEIFVGDNLTFELKNLPFFVLKSIIELENSSLTNFAEITEMGNTEDLMSIIATDILKEHIHTIFTTGKKVDFKIFPILLHMVADFDSILDILASIDVAGIEIDIPDGDLDIMEAKFEGEMDAGDLKEGRNVLETFFCEAVLKAYFSNKSGTYLVNAAAFLEAFIDLEGSVFSLEVVNRGIMEFFGERDYSQAKSGESNESLSEIEKLQNLKKIVFQQIL